MHVVAHVLSRVTRVNNLHSFVLAGLYCLNVEVDPVRLPPVFTEGEDGVRGSTTWPHPRDVTRCIQSNATTRAGGCLVKAMGSVRSGRDRSLYSNSIWYEHSEGMSTKTAMGQHFEHVAGALCKYPLS